MSRVRKLFRGNNRFRKTILATPKTWEMVSGADNRPFGPKNPACASRTPDSCRAGQRPIQPQLTALLPGHNTPCVRPESLLEVEAGCKQVLAGKAEVIDPGEGMLEYRVPGITAFSFLRSSDTKP